MATGSVLGHKVRRIRRQRGLSQVVLARQLEISPSYLNLIEHNQRPLTTALMVKVAERFDVDLQTFAEQDEARLIADLEEITGDPILEDYALVREDFVDLVGAAPEAARAVIALYRAYRGALGNVTALTERMDDDTFLTAAAHETLTSLTSIRSFAEILIETNDLPGDERARFLTIIGDESQRLAEVVGEMVQLARGEGLRGLFGAKAPDEEVTDLIERHSNHFVELELAAEAFRARAKLGRRDLRDGLLRAMRRGSDGVLFEAAREGGKSLTDPTARGTIDGPLLLSDAMPYHHQVFALAHRAGLIHAAEALDAYVDDDLLTTSAARDLGRAILARYFAAAVILPYGVFFEAARTTRYDVDELTRRFGVSIEQVCHRLTTLQRPGQAGLPVHFVRVDIAGNISKRFSASGMRIPRFGGACPRWVVHAAFLRPGEVRTQISEMPDGARFFNAARTIAKSGGGFHAPKSFHAVGLGVPIERAGEFIYADGHDLERAETVVPVGINCRLCQRHDCAQRAHRAIAVSGEGASGRTSGRTSGTPDVGVSGAY